MDKRAFRHLYSLGRSGALSTLSGAYLSLAPAETMPVSLTLTAQTTVRNGHLVRTGIPSLSQGRTELVSLVYYDSSGIDTRHTIEYFSEPLSATKDIADTAELTEGIITRHTVYTVLDGTEEVVLRSEVDTLCVFSVPVPVACPNMSAFVSNLFHEVGGEEGFAAPFCGAVMKGLFLFSLDESVRTVEDACAFLAAFRPELVLRRTEPVTDRIDTPLPPLYLGDCGVTTDDNLLLTITYRAVQ